MIIKYKDLYENFKLPNFTQDNLLVYCLKVEKYITDIFHLQIDYKKDFKEE